MSWISSSLLAWGAIAVLLFWFVGVHNRIVRLRSAALQNYAALDALLRRQLDFVEASVDTSTGESPRPGAAALRATALQAQTILAATRLSPLDSRAMATLTTALHVMLAAWARQHPDNVVSFAADGTLSRPAAPLLGPRERGDVAVPPEAAPMGWPEPSALTEITRAQFNAAVRQYNAAIGQFPALLAAWVLRLKPAATLA